MPAAPTPLTPEQLAAKKAEIAQQQRADLAVATEADDAVQHLAYEIHCAERPALPPYSYADSLREAATRMLAQGKDLPDAAVERLRLYAPDAPLPDAPTPIIQAVHAAETAAA